MFLLDDLISLVYPRICLACGNSLVKSEQVICTSCNFHLPKTNFHLERENMVSKLFWGRVNIQNAASYYYFQKGSKIQHLIHQLKYNNRKEVGIYIGKQYGAELKNSQLFGNIDLIIPVPLHKKKLKRRGYNQSDIFAEGLADSLNVKVYKDILFRAVDTDSQTRKSKFSRWENVKEIFQINNKDILKGQHILLADDVVTTGATIEACATTLLEIPDTKVSVVTIACANS